MNTISETNRNYSYSELQKSLGARQRDVYNLLKNGSLTITEIAEKLRLGNSSISGRVRELNEKCLIHGLLSKKNLKTGVKNTLWTVTTESEIDFIRRAKINALKEQYIGLSSDLTYGMSIYTENLITEELKIVERKLKILNSW